MIKKALAEAKSRAYEDFYQKLETKEGEKYIFELAKAWSRKNKQDLATMKYIKYEDGELLLRQEDIRMRCRIYFS